MPDAAAEKARRTMLMVEIPRDELAFRIMCAATELRPPAGMTAREAFAQAEHVTPGMVEVFRRQADVAVAYFHECINAARQTS